MENLVSKKPRKETVENESRAEKADTAGIIPAQRGPTTLQNLAADRGGITAAAIPVAPVAPAPVAAGPAAAGPAAIAPLTRPVLVITSKRVLALRELWDSRYVLRQLAKKDITLRYRQTALGVLWVVLQPLVASSLLAFVFGSIANLSSGDVPYVVYAYCGFLAWNGFSNVLGRASMSIIANASMVTKVYFPRIVLPFSTAVSALIDQIVGTVVLLGLLLVTGTGVSVKILLLPLVLLGMTSFAVGIGSWLGALAVPYRDINYIQPVMTQFLLFASPVAFGLENVPRNAAPWMRINPLTGWLELSRWCALPGRAFPGSFLLWSASATVIAVVGGAFAFSRMEKSFADVV